MLTLWRRSGAILALGVMLILSPGVMPGWADGMDQRATREGSDLRRFAEELGTGGALTFYEETENLLRAGKFERAFSRFLFLKAHIRGEALYPALNASVDQRLQFLRSQLSLGMDTTDYQKLKIRARSQPSRAQPPSPSSPDQKTDKPPTPAAATPTATKTESPESQASAARSDEKPSALVIPPPITADQGKTTPNEEKKLPGEEVQEEKPQAKKPTPPPSWWEKIKRRLKFW